MFVKKTAVLSGLKSGQRPMTAGFSGNSVSCEVRVGAEGEIGIIWEGGVAFSEIERGRCNVNADITGGFAACVFNGGRAEYYCDCGYQDGKEKLIKAYAGKGRSDVNIPYDDFAIASENYYERSGGIYPLSAEEMCDKGHFSNCGELGQNQNSTSYQQNVDKYAEVNDGSKSSVIEERADDIEAPREGAQTAGGEDGDGEDEVCDSPLPQYYENIKEGLNSLFASYPHVRELETLIGESDFVEIPYSEGKSYIAGLMRYRGEPQYVVFGVPAFYTDTPPAEFSAAYFVPKSPFLRDKGYFLFYQSVADGSVIPNPKRQNKGV